MKDWKLPHKMMLVLDFDHAVAIVHYNETRKYYEDRGFKFKKVNWERKRVFHISKTCSIKLLKKAKDIIKALGFEPDELYIPDQEGIALLHFGGDYAIAIAPRIDDGDDD